MRSVLARVTVVGALTLGIAAFEIGAADMASAATGDTLTAGEYLSAGQFLVSADGRYTAVVQGDGNVVVNGPAGPGWSLVGNGANRLVLQDDGNLVADDATGQPTWSSGTATSRGDRLVMQSDGNLVLWSANGIALWANGTTIQGADTLAAGQQLTAGQSLVSADGRFVATMQADGNVVVYGPDGAHWASGVSAANRVLMQADGNLVAYTGSGAAAWSSGTAATHGDRLVMQNDGNLVIVGIASTGSTTVWSNGRLPSSAPSRPRGPAIRSFQAWALDPSNWSGTTPVGSPGIDSDGAYGAQCADLGIAWSRQVGHPSPFDGLDDSASTKPGWHVVTGTLAAARPGDVVTLVGGRRHVVVVVGSPSKGAISVLQENPGSPALASYPTTTSGVIWRLN